MSDPTYHKGPRNYGTGFDMMDRIEELEAACWRMQEERARAIAWRDSDKDRADKAEAKLAKAVGLLEAWENVATHCTIQEGVCCCGEGMDTHAEPMDCGHSPVDHGAYIASGLAENTRATLAELKGTDK